MTDARSKRLLGHARKAGYDMLIAVEPENLYYMTGFWGEAVAVLGPGGAVIVAPELEASRARDESGCEVVTAARGAGMFSQLAKLVGRKKACTDCRGHAELAAMKRHAPRIKADEAPFYACRAVKDAAELGVIRKASRIIDGMFALCQGRIRAGMRESELQAILVAHAAKHGMHDTGYRHTLNPLIIAGGPNGALPHAQVTERRFQRGDLVVADITMRYMGYVSDATRTFAVGRPSDEARHVYGIVRESQKAGLRAVRAGASCRTVDLACRRIIEESGYGKYFVHSTGHGVGLEVHEPPAVSLRSKARLKKGMAITVEPGIYLPGRLGVRIEDSLAVGSRAAVMHRFPKDLL